MTLSSDAPRLDGARISVRPITLSAPDRGDDLQVRVSAPLAGEHLPVIVMAHGFGGSMSSYDPLVDYWTAHGFVVVQPTFLDSATLGLTPADPRYPAIWSVRVDDLERVLDTLDGLVSQVPGLAGRVDTDRLAVAGHSWGAQSIGMLIGARVVGADGVAGPGRVDPRIRAAVLFSTAGTGEQNTPFARENFAFMSPDFAEQTVPALVVAGDHDQSRLTTRGPDWFTDVYRQSPGAKHLVTLIGGEHLLGGIVDYHSTETTDESPERVDVVRRASTAFLQTELGVDAGAWDQFAAQAADSDAALATVESK